MDGNRTEFLKRSLLGAATVYNGLTQKIVDAKTVKLFQRRLQIQLKEKAQRKLDSVGYDRRGSKPWQLTYSLRT